MPAHFNEVIMNDKTSTVWRSFEENGFIDHIEFEYPDLHLIHLKDGRVIGINHECVALYVNLDDVYEGGSANRPTIQLYGENQA